MAHPFDVERAREQLADERVRFSKHADENRELQETGRFSGRALGLVRERLRLGAGLMGIFTLGNCVLWLISQPALRQLPALLEVVTLLCIGLTLDLAMLWETRETFQDDRRVTRLAMLYHVARSFSLALYSVKLEVLLGWQPSPITFASISIAAFPLLVPTPPMQLLAVSALAGVSAPLALWLNHVPIEILIHGTFYACISVAVAAFCGQVALGLSAAVSRSGQLGVYRLLEPLSQGKEGALWRAEHRLLARPSAVKVIRLPWVLRRGFSKYLARFQREAQVATRLTSPHSVIVYDYGIADDGSFYYVRELLEGETLQQRVEREGPLSAVAVARIALQVCDSLAEAHELGLVHRRLSPRQIFLCRIGRRNDFVKVLDFGLVDFQQRVHLGTLSRLSSRKPEFPDCLPPEMLVRDTADERTDIYQLGCVLFFLLTGEGLVGSSLDETRAQGASIPDGLARIIQRCVARSPSERYRTVAELEEDLRELMHSGAFDARSEPRLTYSSSAEGCSPSPRQGERAHMSSRQDERADVSAPVDSLGYPQASPFGRVMEIGTQHARAGMTMARHRLERLAMLMVAITVASFPLIAVSDIGAVEARRSLDVGLLLGAQLVMDFAMIMTVRDQRVTTAGTMHVALGYFVLRILFMSAASVQLYELMGLEVTRMSFSLVLLAILPFIVLVEPSRLLVAILGAGGIHLAILETAIPPLQQGRMAAGAIDALTAIGASCACAGLAQKMRRAASRRAYGAYRLTKLLGRGAMGEVWRAEHELLARPAAVKLIAAGRQDPERARAIRSRFEREAQVTARLTSPHTVTLFDYGVSENNTYYYVMELLEGQDLRALVNARGPLPWQETLIVALQVCDSLIEAHALGLVHRDLKPENLFLAKVGRASRFVKVLDFGLTEIERHLQLGLQAEGRLQVAGTPGYIAPEMLLEKPVDARADIYQLGCVMFYLLTGRLVFERPSITALAVAHARETAPRVTEVSPGCVPEEVADLIAQCLEKSPDDRVASARDLELAIQRLLSRLCPSPEGLPGLEPGLLR